jgi:hypothetical protein
VSQAWTSNTPAQKQTPPPQRRRGAIRLPFLSGLPGPHSLDKPGGVIIRWRAEYGPGTWRSRESGWSTGWGRRRLPRSGSRGLWKLRFKARRPTAFGCGLSSQHRNRRPGEGVIRCLIVLAVAQTVRRPGLADRHPLPRSGRQRAWSGWARSLQDIVGWRYAPGVKDFPGRTAHDYVPEAAWVCGIYGREAPSRRGGP